MLANIPHACKHSVRLSTFHMLVTCLCAHKHSACL